MLRRPSPHHFLNRSSIHTRRKLHGAITPEKLVVPQTFVHDYFSANNSIDRGWVKNGLMAAFRSIAEQPPSKSHADDDVFKEGASTPRLQAAQAEVLEIPIPLSAREELPHRRRKRLKAISTGSDPIIPPDASSQLTTAATNLPPSASIRRTLTTYLSLSKPRLSFLIVLTSTAAYSLYPIPDILTTTASLASTTTTTLSASTLTLAYLTTGTFLSSASANTLNMLFEPQYDALMTRTRNRPLVLKLITPTSASLFALTTGLTGLTLLYLGTNPTVATLSALNILLYAGIYTPMKRISVLNTWVGAIVGGIPPLMGWAAAAGQFATAEHHSWQDLLLTEDALGGWLLAAMLFAWQFPHFNALSHSIRDEYKNAGYRMLAWTNPAMNGRVALRYSLLLFPISAALCWAGVVNNGFLALSTVCNLWISREAYRFWSKGGAGGSARGLFWASIWSLPLLMVGGLVCKKGVWDGVFDQGGSADGDDEEDDRIDEREEEREVKKRLALGRGSASGALQHATSTASTAPRAFSEAS
jgi:heme o synthase